MSGDVLSIRVASTSHRIEVVGEHRSDLAIDGKVSVGRNGSVITVDDVASRVTLRVPAASHVTIGTDSGRVDATGPLGHVAVSSVSGRVHIRHVASADVRSETGSVIVEHCGAECRVRGATGRVEVIDCSDADVATTTGKIDLSGVRGAVRAHCVSGRIEVRCDGPNDVDAETVSGRIDVSYPAGIVPIRIGAGDDAPAEGDCVVRVRSATGRVNVSSR